MFRRLSVPLICGILRVSMAACQADQTLVEWRFDTAGDLLGWQANAMLSDVAWRDGAVHMKATDWDPQLLSPSFAIPAGPWQYVDIEMRATASGQADLFWTNTTEGQYGGLSGSKMTSFGVNGDGQFHTYRITPFWQGEKRLILLRLDVYDGAEFDLQAIRVGEVERPVADSLDFDFTRGAQGWQALRDIEQIRNDGGLSFSMSGAGLLASPQLSLSPDNTLFMMVRMAVDRGSACTAHIAPSGQNGLHSFPMALKADGQMHTYNIPIGEAADGILFTPSNEGGAAVCIQSISFGNRPSGPPSLVWTGFAPDIPVTRAGRVIPVSGLLRNDGAVAANIVLELQTDGGVEVIGPAQGSPSNLDFGDDATVTWHVRAAHTGRQTLTVTATCSGQAAPVTESVQVDFTPDLGLPKAEYVPAPTPVASDYHVGVYYFPGWHAGAHVGWDVIKPFPERMPLLGWYDEGNPEVHDWEIKWAVEHGIEFFIFDWYRVGTGGPVQTMLGDALDRGFLNARYRDAMKFSVMWTNVGGTGVADEEDLLVNLLPFWIKSYFSRSNYLHVDGKPMLVVYHPPGVEQDLGGPEQVRIAFDKMRQACQTAGLGGLYLLAICGDDEATLRKLKQEGYDATSHYAYIAPGRSKPVAGMTAYDYSEAIDNHERIWKAKRAVGALPDFPVLTSGWDPRPWHGAQTAFYWTDNTSAKYRDMCLRAKRLLDATPGNGPESTFVLMEALNEWGEGSYLSPSRGFGFSRFDVIREVFSNAPEAHRDITPWDIGLGPYEAAPLPRKTAWDFNTDGDAEGWIPVMGLTTSVVANGVLAARSTNDDPAYNGPGIAAPARQVPVVVIRMKSDHSGAAQFFWSTKLFQISASSAATFQVQGDGQFHEYRLDLSKHPRWWGTLTALRLDPTAVPGTTFEIDYIHLVGK